MKEQPHDAARRGRRLVVVLALGLAMLLLLYPLRPALGQTLEFGGTPWAEAADRHGIEPALLYALTLVESRHSVGPNRVAPWPWTINTPNGSRWFDTRAEAREALDDMLERWPAKRIDIGAAQINLGWHADQVDDPHRLLSLEHNLEVAARILARSVETTSDPVLGVGRYHAWAPESRARSYGRKVWRMYRDVLAGERSTVGNYVFGPDKSASFGGERLAERH